MLLDKSSEDLLLSLYLLYQSLSHHTYTWGSDLGEHLHLSCPWHVECTMLLPWLGGDERVGSLSLEWRHSNTNNLQTRRTLHSADQSDNTGSGSGLPPVDHQDCRRCLRAAWLEAGIWANQWVAQRRRVPQMMRMFLTRARSLWRFPPQLQTLFQREV